MKQIIKGYVWRDRLPSEENHEQHDIHIKMKEPSGFNASHMIPVTVTVEWPDAENKEP